MGRLFIYLAIVATVIGFIVLMPAGDYDPTGPATRSLMPQLVPIGAGWLAGLIMGFALAWVTRIDWRTLPEKIAEWMQLMRHRIWWMAFGGACAGVLLFF